MNKKGYVINTIGSTPVIFEGLNLLKLVEKKNISIDICIYYKIKTYYIDLIYKPLKQNYFYVDVYYFCKLNLFIKKATLKSKKNKNI